jgi:hypothetical protein
MFHIKVFNNITIKIAIKYIRETNHNKKENNPNSKGIMSPVFSLEIIEINKKHKKHIINTIIIS